MGKSVSLGSVLTWNNQTVAALKRIGGIDLTVNMVDVTTHQSTSYFDEVLPGFKKTGEIPIEGIFDPADTSGQVAMQADAFAGTGRAIQITAPNAFSIAASTAYISKLKIGDFDGENPVPFSASIKISGVPTCNYDVSGGLTGMSISGAGTVIVPTFANGTYEYTANIVTAISTVTITPTAASHVIAITVDGVSQTVTSGAASSAITLGAAGSRKTAYITAVESGKIPKLYVVDLVRAAS